MLKIDIGSRYYFEPMIKNLVIVMPVIEAEISISDYKEFIIHKSGAGLPNTTIYETKLGARFAAGFSMFLVDLLLGYNYYKSCQFISLDIKTRIPIFISF